MHNKDKHRMMAMDFIRININISVFYVVDAFSLSFWIDFVRVYLGTFFAIDSKRFYLSFLVESTCSFASAFRQSTTQNYLICLLTEFSRSAIPSKVFLGDTTSI